MTFSPAISCRPKQGYFDFEGHQIESENPRTSNGSAEVVPTASQHDWRVIIQCGRRCPRAGPARSFFLRPQPQLYKPAVFAQSVTDPALASGSSNGVFAVGIEDPRATWRRNVRRPAMLIAVGRDLYAARRKLQWRIASFSSADRCVGAAREPRPQKRPPTIALQC